MTPEELEAENKVLKEQVATLNQRLYTLHFYHVPRHLWMKIFIRDLEDNPHAQYRIHYWGVVYWIINFPLIAWFFFALPSQWLKWGIFITLEYSIYANFATDYGAMSAAMAAFRDNGLPEIPVQPRTMPPGNVKGNSDV